MDADRFADALRRLAMAPSRRGLGRALAVALLAGPLAARLGLADADARKKRKRKKKKKCKGGKKKCGKSCIPRANCCTTADCGADEACTAGACVSTATCSDGRRNGRETDVDCGGECPRCGFGKSCSGPADCRGAFCANDTCQSCSNPGQCGSDANGHCFCEGVEGGSACNSATEPAAIVSDCNQCAAGLNCLDLGNEAWCVFPCGAS